MKETIFLKEFKDIDEQISLLESRGLIIHDHVKAKEYLLTNNYYNIINGYSKFFQNIHNHYVEGATFEEIVQLYFFDKEIKQTLFNSILDIEHHLKSITAYEFAKAHRHGRYKYLDASVYGQNKILSVGYIISKFFKIINNNKRYDDNAIRHYVREYDDVPIWVIVDFLEFGDLSSIIENLSTETQNEIAKDLISFIKDNNENFDSVFTPEIMTSFIKNIRETRNICAHNNRLLNFNCRSDSAYFSAIHDNYGIESDSHRKSMYSTLISMQCFLSKTEYARLHNTIRKRFNQLSNKLNSIDINTVLRSLGFPDDWHTTPKLTQE